MDYLADLNGNDVHQNRVCPTKLCYTHIHRVRTPVDARHIARGRLVWVQEPTGGREYARFISREAHGWHRISQMTAFSCDLVLEALKISPRR
jgi:hypothetical protein